jgi:hypothetical protein
VINSLSFPNFGIALAVAFLLAVLYASFLYFNEKKFSNPSFAKSILVFLRGFVVALIVIILFSPVLKTRKDEVKAPVVVMANDVSGSLDSENSNQFFLEEWGRLGENLSKDYTVKNLEFASQVSEEKLDSFQKKSTNFSGLFKYIDDQYADQNIGAVLIHSDGIFNEGNNPLYMDAFISTPLYIVADGDTTQYKDVMISDVFYNKIVYLGDKFSLQVDVKAFNAAGNSSRLMVESINKGNPKKYFEENISFNNNDFFATRTIELDAGTTGLSRYRIYVTGLSGEKNKVNNYKDIFVEVLDGRQKILILANSPHPDVAAMRQIILENKNYEVTVGYTGETQPALSKFNMVILHNLPSEKYPVKAELEQIRTQKTPTFFIVGNQTSLPLFNQAQELLAIGGNNQNSEEILPDISAEFSAFTVSEELKRSIKVFPPLITPFGEYKVKGNGFVFTTQNIKKIKTNYPQLVFGESRGVRTAIFCGEGLWKWKLSDYVQNQSYERVSEIFNKSLQWTSVKEDKRKFRVTPGKTSYKENEPILVEGQLYNDNFELVNEPDATLIIKSDEGKEYKYTFSKTSKSYTLNAGMFPSGTYSIYGSVTFNNQLLKAQNTFTIESVNLEQQDKVAKHDVLRSLVKKYGGKLIYKDDLPNLSELIKKDESIKPMIYQSNLTKSVIHLKWICILILLLLGLEWFIRRYLGSY